MINKVKEIFRYRHLILNLIHRDLADRYKRSYLGLLWALLEPLGFMLIYTLVFSYIIRLNIPDYPIFLLCGLLPWIYFSKSLVYCTESIMINSRLVRKIYFPREVLPIASVLSRLVNFIISMILYMILLFVFARLRLSSLPSLLVIVLIQTSLSIGLALILSCLNVYFQDTKLLVDFLVLIWFYASPVLYPISMVPGRLKPFYILNPMAGILSAYRNLLIFDKSFVSLEFKIAILYAVVILFLGMTLFAKLNRRLGEMV